MFGRTTLLLLLLVVVVLVVVVVEEITEGDAAGKVALRAILIASLASTSMGREGKHIFSERGHQTSLREELFWENGSK